MGSGRPHSNIVPEEGTREESSHRGILGRHRGDGMPSWVNCRHGRLPLPLVGRGRLAYPGDAPPDDDQRTAVNTTAGSQTEGGAFMSMGSNRRDVLKLSGLSAAAGVATLGASAGNLLSPARAYAQAKSDSLLRTVLDRGK